MEEAVPIRLILIIVTVVVLIAITTGCSWSNRSDRQEDGPPADLTVGTNEPLLEPTATTVASGVRSPETLRSTPTPFGDYDWDELRRPLELPVVESAEDCPVEGLTRAAPDFGPVAGREPVYVTSITPEGMLQSAGGLPDPDSWYYYKMLWVVVPSYEGPVLIRGTRLDDVGELRFSLETGDFHPDSELQLGGHGGRSSTPGWRHWGTYIRFLDAGCYAVQVDGLDFSYPITFRIPEES